LKKRISEIERTAGGMVEIGIVVLVEPVAGKMVAGLEKVEMEMVATGACKKESFVETAEAVYLEVLGESGALARQIGWTKAQSP
jgi:hypothetical protein